MKKNCPNSNCPHFNTNTKTIKNGLYARKEDARSIQRYKCKVCKIKFSAATSKFSYRAKNQDDLSQIKESICNLQMDDLITKENSKLKHLSVTIAVNEDTRIILGAKCSQIAAFGHLSKKAIETYGKRECHLVKGSLRKSSTIRYLESITLVPCLGRI